ncbi:Crp/Fnr family transcriptional regulator [Clostridium sp. C2-6-12]|uniref:Crp/Fnr family transcriptional regulator n=1 Tax=Clostridium sp. C2-6-12 TaxID=2698832 RepID=UPI001369AFFB|nr:Crp/Fnr family transcriptional regulator [Clostridium sp. C2-6-12]
MTNYNAVENEKIKKIEALYKNYPILNTINHKNNNIINNQAIFKTVYADEYVKATEGACVGILFVLSGTIKIQRINAEGEETNLYNIGHGEFCHEALSCISNFESLNITGKAVQDSEVCIIPLDIARSYLIKDNEFLTYIYGDLYKKFITVIENKEEIVHESLETRLLKLLINKNSKIIYTTHSELAFEIDSAREVVSRKLKSLEKRGYIELGRGKIIIVKNLKDIL